MGTLMNAQMAREREAKSDDGSSPKTSNSPCRGVLPPLLEVHVDSNHTQEPASSGKERQKAATLCTGLGSKARSLA